MAFLRLKDYTLIIQDKQLSEITGGVDTIRTTLERSAQELISSHLRQRWDISGVFRDTVVYKFTDSYSDNQLVELNSPAYDATKTYVVNDLVTNSGVSYICKTAFGPAPWDATKFDIIGNQYDLFYIAPPYPAFDYGNVYYAGDFVTWKGKVYKCLQDTPTIDHAMALQFAQYENIPSSNVFPDDRTLGTQYWQRGLTYSFKGYRVTNPTASAWSNATAYVVGDRALYNGIVYQCFAANTNNIPGDDVINWAPIGWTAGDNRNPDLLAKTIMVAVYYMHHRIAPQNVPKSRGDDYQAILDWLHLVSNAKVMVDLPQLQPAQGRTIRSGGDVKKINEY